MQNFDTIIIGSWLWWLSAWALLSKKWQKVLVLEKHYLAWWYATNFKRKNYEFDVALHQIWWVNKTWFKSILKKSWIYDKLEFIKHKYLYESIYPDFTIKVENWNVKKLKNDLINIFPKEKNWIKLWFFIMNYVWLQTRLWDFTNRNKIFFPFIMFFAPILIPFLVFFWKIKISQVLNLCTKDRKLQRSFMELIWYYWDDYEISAIYYLIPSYGYYFDSWYYVKWWWQAISNAFIDVIKENWWSIKINSEVKEIIIENEKAILVKTDKETFYAKNIICNASPFILYENLLKNWEWNKIELEKLKKYEIWPSISSVYIWLNTTIENLNPNFKESYIVTKNEDYSFNIENSIWFTITKNIDNPQSQEWKTIITVAIFEKYNDWKNFNSDEYKIKKEEKTQEIIKKLEEFFPEIRKYIEVIEYGTPKTMERYTWNKSWAVYGFSQKVSQNWVYWNKTPIKNLFLSSAWSFGWWFEWAIRAGNEVIKNIK